MNPFQPFDWFIRKKQKCGSRRKKICEKFLLFRNSRKEEKVHEVFILFIFIKLSVESVN